MNQKKIVAFAVNEAYIPYLEIALFSLLKNNQKSIFKIYVLSSDIRQESVKRLNNICKNQKNAEVKVIKLGKDSFDDFKVRAHFSKDMYSRYLLPDLLPNEDKVLYLDVDILIKGDISELYNTDLTDYSLAAIKDICIRKPEFRGYIDSLGLDGDNYYNSGVLLMNTGRIRKLKKVQKLLKTTRDLTDKLRHPDQDVINIVFKNDIKELSNIWNFQDEDRRMNQHRLQDAKIVHYTTADKPWNKTTLRRYNERAHELYKEYDYKYLKTIYTAPLVSVIVPIYNVEKYLPECIDSILAQTYLNLEIIIVDDKTPDSSGKIADDYAKRDERIKVIHKLKNEGVNMARATGFQESAGEFVMFVDSDDMITGDCIQEAMKALVENKTDFVRFKEAKFKNRSTLNEALTAKQPDEIEIIDNKADLFRKRFSGGTNVCVWGAIYPRKLIEKIDWKRANYKVNEDIIWTQQLLSFCDSGTYLPHIGYLYRSDNTTSKGKNITGDSFNDRPVGFLEFAGLVVEDARKYNKKYRLGIEKEIDDYEGWLYRDRVQRITEADGWELENNITFASKALGHLIDNCERLAEQDVLLQHQITQLEAEKITLKTELESFLSIKRSMKLVLGNIRRYLIRFWRRLVFYSDHKAKNNLVMYPHINNTNKYTALVDLHLRKANFNVLPLNYENIDKSGYVYLHWFESLWVDNKQEAEALFYERMELLRYLRQHNKKILWQVHNKIPHDSKYTNLEKKLMITLAESSYKIMIHSNATRDAVKGLCDNEEIMSKIFYIPHPNYIGAYGKCLEKDKLDNDRLRLLFIGRVSPYKNIELLIRTVKKYPEICITIAGSSDDEYAKKLIKMVGASKNINLDLRFIADKDLPKLLAEHHALICPYNLESSLNSGATILAFSYARTVISPMTGTLQDIKNKKLYFGYSYENQADHQLQLDKVLQKIIQDYRGQYDRLLGIGKKDQDYIRKATKINYKAVLRG